MKRIFTVLLLGISLSVIAQEEMKVHRINYKGEIVNAYIVKVNHWLCAPAQTEYLDSLPDGKFIAFKNKDSLIDLIGYYKNLLKDSVWTSYNETGKITSIEHYNLGIKNGMQFGLYAGDTLLLGNYVQGSKQGLWIEPATEHFQFELNYYSFHKGNYSNGSREGEWKTYLVGGKKWLDEVTHYHNGLKNGKVTYYLYTGELRCEEEYKDDVIVKTTCEWKNE